MSVYEARVGIYGPSIFIITSPSSEVLTVNKADGLLICPKRDPLYLTISDGIAGQKSEVPTEDLVFEALKEEAIKWIESQKGRLAEFLTHNLCFAEVHQARLMYLKYKNQFESLKSLPTQNYSESLREAVVLLTKSPGFTIN